MKLLYISRDPHQAYRWQTAAVSLSIVCGDMALSVEYRTCNREVVGSSLGRARGVKTLGKFLTPMCLCSPSSIIGTGQLNKSWHLYLAPESQNATTAPGGIHNCPNRYVFSRLLNVFSDRLLSRSADCRLLHTVGPWKAKLQWPTNVCTLGRSTHPKAGMVCVWVAGKTVWSPCYTQVISEHFGDQLGIIKRYRNGLFTLHYIT